METIAGIEGIEFYNLVDYVSTDFVGNASNCRNFTCGLFGELGLTCGGSCQLFIW